MPDASTAGNSANGSRCCTGASTPSGSAIDEHTTRYIDRETFHGLLVPSPRHTLGTRTKAGMVAMGEALKHRVKTAAVDSSG